MTPRSGTGIRKISVADVMDHRLHKAPANSTLSEAAVMMAVAAVGSMLVMEDEQLIGIFTERDLVRALAYSPDTPADPISAWMTPSPQTTSESESIEDALRRMIAGNFRHLPVVDNKKNVIGMVSIRDLAFARRAPVSHSHDPQRRRTRKAGVS